MTTPWHHRRLRVRPGGRRTSAAVRLRAHLLALGAATLRQRGEDFARAVAGGLEVLPGLIIDVLPDLMVALTEAIGDALLTLPEAIGDALEAAAARRGGQP